MDRTTGRTSNRRKTSFHAARVKVRERKRSESQHGQFKQNRARVRERRGRILILLSMLFGVELAAAVLTSPLLSIWRVSIEGISQLPPEEYRATVQAAGLRSDVNLVRFPIARYRTHMSSLPWIRSAGCRYASNQALRLVCTVRQPVAVLTLGGAAYELDENAVPIRLARAETLGRLPLVEMERAVEVRPGTQIAEEAVRAAIEVYRDASSQPMVHISKIHIDQNANLCLNMHDAMPINLGQTDNLHWKISYVRSLYTVNPDVARDLLAVDLSCPREPVCTPRRAPAVNNGVTATVSANGQSGSKL